MQEGLWSPGRGGETTKARETAEIKDGLRLQGVPWGMKDHQPVKTPSKNWHRHNVKIKTCTVARVRGPWLLGKDKPPRTVKGHDFAATEDTQNGTTK